MTDPDQPGIPPEAPRSLEFMRPRDSKRAMRARSVGTTRFVNRMRYILPGAGLVILAAIVIWPWIDPSTVRSMIVKNIPDLVVEHLHFTGLDSKNQPYFMSSMRATRPGGVANIYDLDKPQGDIQMQSGAWIAGKALYGRYNQDTRQLWLGGDVQLFHDKGYQFTTDEAQVDINDENAWGEKPVLIQGDFGEIRGTGFRVLDNGAVVIVKGPAKATLHLHDAQASDKPAEATNQPVDTTNP